MLFPSEAARILYRGLLRRGFAFRAAAGGLAVSPASRLTDADRAAIRVHTEPLLDLAWADAPSAFVPGRDFLWPDLDRRTHWSKRAAAPARSLRDREEDADDASG